MKRILSLACCLLCVLHAFAQSEASATADKRKILIGEQFGLELRAVFPEGGSFEWFDVDSLAHFEILQRSKIDTQQVAGGTAGSQTLTLTSWDSGRYTIPALELGRARTKPISIDVSYTPFDTTQPYHEIKDIIDVQKPEQSKWIWYVAIGLLLLVFFLLFFPKGKKQEQPAPVVAPPSEDAYRKALARLDNLSPEGDNRIYYTELTDILRDYLHRQKGIQSFSKTTDDLAVQIGRLGLPNDLYNRLLQSLRLSDMVKFARFQPLQEENRESRTVVRESIIAIEELK
ncbi:MAG TPA: BatD family protein [Flavisolibacter sp.]|jgi:hypothetical protein